MKNEFFRDNPGPRFDAICPFLRMEEGKDGKPEAYMFLPDFDFSFRMPSGCRDGRSGNKTHPSQWSHSHSHGLRPRLLTNTGMAASPTQSETRTLPPTHTPFPTETKTTRPTHIPTPTRGLPPTITFSPETCPPPTYEKVNIQYSGDIWDYGPQILEYFRAYGDRGDLGLSLRRLGKSAQHCPIHRGGCNRRSSKRNHHNAETILAPDF